jgi:hypothetical protein
VIEEIAYLSLVEPDVCAERLAAFGYRALLSGWSEAAGRASMVVRPTIAQDDSSLHLTTTVLLLEGVVSAIAKDGRLTRSELRRLNSIANEAEHAEYAAESLQLLAGFVHDFTVARPPVKSTRLVALRRDPGRQDSRLIALQRNDTALVLPKAITALGSREIEVDEEVPTSRPLDRIEAPIEVRINFKRSDFRLLVTHRAESVLTALISILLVAAGAGVGVLLSHNSNLGPVWVTSGIYAPTALFLIIRISTYIASRDEQRGRHNVSTRIGSTSEDADLPEEAERHSRYWEDS